MKEILCALLCSLANSTYSQIVALENRNENVAIICRPNHLVVAASNCKPQELKLRTDNGYLEKGENVGEYTYYPRKIGKATIYISRNVNKKNVLLAKKEFRIKRYNNVVASFGGIYKTAKNCQCILPERCMQISKAIVCQRHIQ